jgi:hypothetical protein
VEPVAEEGLLFSAKRPCGKHVAEKACGSCLKGPAKTFAEKALRNLLLNRFVG